MSKSQNPERFFSSPELRNSKPAGAISCSQGPRERENPLGNPRRPHFQKQLIAAPKPAIACGCRRPASISAPRSVLDLALSDEITGLQIPAAIVAGRPNSDPAYSSHTEFPLLMDQRHPLLRPGAEKIARSSAIGNAPSV